MDSGSIVGILWYAKHLSDSLTGALEAYKKRFTLAANVVFVNPSQIFESSLVHVFPDPKVALNHAVIGKISETEIIKKQTNMWTAPVVVTEVKESVSTTPVKRGRGRPRKYPLPSSV